MILISCLDAVASLFVETEASYHGKSTASAVPRLGTMIILQDLDGTSFDVYAFVLFAF